MLDDLLPGLAIAPRCRIEECSQQPRCSARWEFVIQTPAHHAFAAFGYSGPWKQVWPGR